ncbi:MAG TPA: helix-turn-helix domain-containing protein, partial [Candidatus Paceibacterota bacterium]
MTELLLETLISTREASTLSGYNPDYLARLCRAQKIAGKRIGRTWYVERDSLESFVRAQEAHREKLAKDLSSAREREYREAQTAAHAAALPTPSARLPRRSPFTPTTTSVTQRPAFALLITLLVVAGSAYASVSDGYALAGERVVRAAEAFAAPQPAFYAGPVTFLPREQVRPAIATPRALAALNTPNSIHVPAHSIAPVDSTSIAREIDQTEEAVTAVAAARTALLANVVENPADALARAELVAWNSYVGIGEAFVGGSEKLFESYVHSVVGVGESALAISARMRDEGARAPGYAHAAREAYENSVYAWAELSPEIPKALTQSTLALGAALGNFAADAPRATAATTRDGALAFASAVERTLPQNTSEAYVQAEQPVSTHLTGNVSLAPVLWADVSQWFGELVALVVDPISRFVKDTARTVTEIVHIERIVFLPAPTSEDRLGAPVPALGSSTTTIVQQNVSRTEFLGGTTVIRNYYPQTTVLGVTEALLESRLEGMRTSVRKSIESALTSSRRSSSGSSSSGGGASLNSPTFTGTATFDNAAVQNDLSV